MPLPGYLTIVGELQGEFEGPCELEEREGSMVIQAFEHTVEIPTDDRGVTSGRRVHRPMVITKDIDRCTPMLYQALCTGERLTKVELDWYRIDETGSEELYYTVELENALISKIHPWVPNVLDKNMSGFRHMEDVSIIYEKIIWTWELDGVEFEDAFSEMAE